MKTNTLPTLTPAQAQAAADAYNAAHPGDACAKRFDDCQACTYARLPDVLAWFEAAGRDRCNDVIRAEAVSGWFVTDDDNDPDQDEDGDFVSTPCYCDAFADWEDEDFAESRLADFLADASRCGLLLVDPAFFA